MEFLGLHLPLFIAHRGASALAPENTLAAFRLAIEAGMELAECDLRRTRDGRIVIMHDAQVNRTTDGTGLVSELTLEQIKSLDAGSWFDPRFHGERVPTLEQFLEQVAGHLRPVLELKEEGLESDVVTALAQRRLTGEALIVSFLEGALERIHRLEPTLATGYLYGDQTKARTALQNAVGLGACMLGPWEGLVTPSLVEEAHAQGLLVQAWTVDDRQRMADLLSIPVDVITTNCPLTPDERKRLVGP